MTMLTGDAYIPRPIEPVRPVMPPEPEAIEDSFARPQQEGFIPVEEAEEEEEPENEMPELGLTEEDEDDLFGVSREDVMGEPPRPKKPKPRFRIRRPYYQPPNILGLR